MSEDRLLRVYLAGFMGSGKSTVAPPLARALGCDWLDTDSEVERKTGMAIAEIFSREGEPWFRRIEKEVLFDTASRRPVVVATGGGTIANEECLAFVRSAGLLVYLKVEFETLFTRLKTGRSRPLLTTDRPAAGDERLLRETMLRLLSEREPYYLRADLVVIPDADDPAATASRIAESIDRLRAG
jgi:shikimate kinase